MTSNYLFGKIAAYDSPRRMLDTPDKLFEEQDLSKSVDYLWEYKLERGEWSRLKDFSHTYTLPIKENWWLKGSLEKKHFEKIQYICAIQSNLHYYQKVTKVQIAKKGFVSKSFVFERAPSLILKNPPDAIYDSKSDVLYFKNLTRIESIFEGVSSLFREATDVQIGEFLGFSLLAIPENTEFGDLLDKHQRKRLGKALCSFKSYKYEERKTLINKICKFFDFKKNEEGQILISDKQDVKDLLVGLNEHFFTTAAGNEKKTTNSSQKVKR